MFYFVTGKENKYFWKCWSKVSLSSMFSISLKISGMKWKLITATLSFSRLCYRMCLQTGLREFIYKRGLAQEEKTKIVLLLSDSETQPGIYLEKALGMSLGIQCVLGPLWEEWPKATILLSLKPTGYRSPQSVKVEDTDSGFLTKTFPLCYPHEKCFLQWTLYLRANKEPALSDQAEFFLTRTVSVFKDNQQLWI